MEDFQVANSTKDSGFPTLPDNFTRHTPLRISTVDLNESINHLFDITYGHKVEEPLLNKSNKSKHKQIGILVSLSWTFYVVILPHTTYYMAHIEQF